MTTQFTHFDTTVIERGADHEITSFDLINSIYCLFFKIWSDSTFFFLLFALFISFYL